MKPASFRVLVVDDETTIADSMTMILKRAGYDAMAVYSGEAALEVAEVIKPNVLITDVNMGKVNGVKVAIQIEKKLPECRIILFTGTPLNNHLIKNARAAGHRFEVLQKPIPPVKILSLLRQHTDEAA